MPLLTELPSLSDHRLLSRASIIAVSSRLQQVLGEYWAIWVLTWIGFIQCLAGLPFSCLAFVLRFGLSILNEEVIFIWLSTIGLPITLGWPLFLDLVAVCPLGQFSSLDCQLPWFGFYPPFWRSFYAEHSWVFPPCWR